MYKLLITTAVNQGGSIMSANSVVTEFPNALDANYAYDLITARVSKEPLDEATRTAYAAAPEEAAFEFAFARFKDETLIELSAFKLY